MWTWAERHPNLATWAVLAVGMIVVLAWSARDVELAASQRFWLGAATVGLAGLCAWIISWEADEEGDEDWDDAGSEARDPESAPTAGGMQDAGLDRDGAAPVGPEPVAEGAQPSSDRPTTGHA